MKIIAESCVCAAAVIFSALDSEKKNFISAPHEKVRELSLLFLSCIWLRQICPIFGRSSPTQHDIRKICAVISRIVSVRIIIISKIYHSKKQAKTFRVNQRSCRGQNNYQIILSSVSKKKNQNNYHQKSEIQTHCHSSHSLRDDSENFTKFNPHENFTKI